MVRYFDLWAKLQTHELRRYIEASEEAFSKALDDYAEYVADQAKGMTREQQEKYHDFAADKAFALDYHFPRIARHMAFAATFGHFEHTLLSLCDRIQKIRSLPERKPFKHQGLEAAKRYMKDVAKISFPAGGKHWQRMVVYGRIRNLILSRESRTLSRRPTSPARDKGSWSR